MRFADRAVILDLIERTKSNFRFEILPKKWCKDKEIILKLLEYGSPWNDDLIKEIWNDDADVILAACSHHQFYFTYASDRLKDHLDTVLQAIDFGVNLEDISERLRNHPLVIEKILALRPKENICLLPLEMTQQKEFILQQIRDNGIYISYLFRDYPLWKNDEDIIFELVKSSVHYDFKDLPHQFKDDPDLLKIAIEKKPSHFEHISYRLKDDLDFVEFVIRKDWRLMKYASNRCQQDPHLMALTKNLIQMESKLYFYDIECLPLSYQEDDALYEYMKSKCSQDINQYIELKRWNPSRLIDDIEIVTAQIQLHWSHFIDASPKIQANDELYGAFKKRLIEYLYQKKGFLDHVEENLSRRSLSYVVRCQEDLEVMIAAGCARYQLLDYASDALKSNRDLALTTVKSDWRAIEYLDPKFQQDEEIYQIIKNQILMQLKNQTLVAEDQMMIDLKSLGFKRLFEDQEVMTLAIRKDWSCIDLVS